MFAQHYLLDVWYMRYKYYNRERDYVMYSRYGAALHSGGAGSKTTPPPPHTHLLPYAYIMPKINKTYCAEIHVLWETWMVCRNAIADFNLM